MFTISSAVNKDSLIHFYKKVVFVGISVFSLLHSYIRALTPSDLLVDTGIHFSEYYSFHRVSYTDNLPKGILLTRLPVAWKRSIRVNNRELWYIIIVIGWLLYIFLTFDI